MDINGKSTAAESLPTGRIYIKSDEAPAIDIPATESITLKDILDRVKDMFDRVAILEKEYAELKELVMDTLERIQEDGD